MTSRNSFAGLARITLALSLALAATACGFGKTPEERALDRTDALLDDIGATDAQRSTVRDAVLTMTRSFAATHTVHAAEKETLVAQLQGEQADRLAIDAAADRLTTSMVKSAHVFVDQAALVHTTLTPAQRTALSDRVKPSRGMKAAFFLAGHLGYGLPADVAEGRARATARLEKGLDAIDATDAQRQVLRPLVAKVIEQALPLMEDRDVVAEALLTAWKSEQVDAASLHALVDREAALVKELSRGAADAFVQAHEILTPAQRQQLGKTLAADGHGCG